MNKVNEIATVLTEECAEVIQAISKCQRFGFDSINPKTNIENITSLEEELGDLMCCVNLLIDSNIGITKEGVTAAMTRKREKLQIWSNIFKDIDT